MKNSQLTSQWNRAVAKDGEEKAYDSLLLKYPDSEIELNMLATGKALPEDVKEVNKPVPTIIAPDDADPLGNVTGLAHIDSGDADDDFIPVPQVKKKETAMSKPKSATVATVTMPSAEQKAEKKIENVTAPVTESKTVTVTAPAEKAVPVEKTMSKAQLALQLYNSAEDKTRKIMIGRFQTELGLTKAGAATYLQNIRKKLGLVGQ